MSWKLIVFILIVLIVISIYLKLNFKHLRVPSFCLITGGVKTGKSLLGSTLSTKDFRRVHCAWWIKHHIFRKDEEEPLFYTNSEISFGNRKRKKKHRLDKCIRPLEKAHLLREKRFNYKSIIYVSECSLLADNMLFNDTNLNVDLSLWAKLVSHETRGGKVYFDTQSILDSHYAFKRVASTYLFIQKSYDFKLFHVLYVREMINSENGVNSFNEDADFTMRKVIIPFWYHNRYNRYEFSYLTDDLKNDTLPYKIHNGVVSFNPLYESRANKCNKEGVDNK